MWRTREDAIQLGRSLRSKTARISHAEWNAPADRRDPVDILMESSEGREPNLIPIRYGRMLQSPFNFFRGAAAIMAADLATTPNTDIFVQSCGDCHLMNFGSFATPERKIIFDLNDFDETHPAPWEWDVKRLAASFVIASLHNDIGKGVAKAIARECAQSYRKHTAEFATMTPLQVWYSAISAEDILSRTKNEEIKKRYTRRIEKARSEYSRGENFPKLREDEDGRMCIQDNPPLIYHRSGEDMEKYHQLVEDIFEGYIAALGDEKKMLLDQYKYQDIAAKVVGIGSVGMMCGISLRMSASREPLFLQVKEARASVLEPYVRKSAYSNNGQRVVIGQKLMQAASDLFLGWTQPVHSRHFYVRQLRDMKIKSMVEVYEEENMFGYARLCGWALARAHARSGKATIITGYLGENTKFDDAVAQFAAEYAQQNDSDFAALQAAVRKGTIEVYLER
jgi:uncharacterized protein (DUF2252 family)